MRLKDYAVYKGDAFVMIGNKFEIAKELNIKPSTVYFMTMPTYKKRTANGKDVLIVIDIDAADDEQEAGE